MYTYYVNAKYREKQQYMITQLKHEYCVHSLITLPHNCSYTIYRLSVKHILYSIGSIISLL